MIASIGANFMTRIPGAVGLLWFLPLLHTGIGTSNYADVLSALALGGTASFLIGGFITIGRRMVGEAYGNRDQAAEADAFTSILVAGLVATALSAFAVILYCRFEVTSTAFLIISTVSVVGTYIALSEAIWAAYNQHYISATLLIVLQSIGFATGLTLPAASTNVMLGGAVLLAPYVLTSVVATGLLLRSKPYLLKGRPVAVWYIVRQGSMLAMADGFMMATLGIAVVWVQAKGDPIDAAWFATVVRLFQTFLVPVSLLLMPLSSYIRYRWNFKTMAQQHTYTKLALGIGMAYGTVVGLGLLLISRLYVSYLLGLPVPDDVAVFVLFGVIVAYKSYSSVVYVVLANETMHLSFWTTAAVGLAMIAGGVASLRIADPMDVIDLYALVAGVAVILVLMRSVARFVSTPSTVAIS